jgi:hypothetical protein
MIPAVDKPDAIRTHQQLLEDSSQLAYTTVSCEAEFVEDRSNLQAAVYRVSFSAAGLRSRKLALAPTLVTWQSHVTTVAFVNSYYGSMLKRSLDPTYLAGAAGSAGDDGSPSYNFFPYALVWCSMFEGLMQTFHTLRLLVPGLACCED